MPRIDGMELLRRVHQRPNPPEVIMLTGQATVETAVEAMKLGAYDYLSKPYNIIELDVRVKQAADKRRLRGDITAPRGMCAQTRVLHSRPSFFGRLPNEDIAPNAALTLAQ